MGRMDSFSRFWTRFLSSSRFWTGFLCSSWLWAGWNLSPGYRQDFCLLQVMGRILSPWFWAGFLSSPGNGQDGFLLLVMGMMNSFSRFWTEFLPLPRFWTGFLPFPRFWTGFLPFPRFWTGFLLSPRLWAGSLPLEPGLDLLPTPGMPAFMRNVGRSGNNNGAPTEPPAVGVAFPFLGFPCGNREPPALAGGFSGGCFGNARLDEAEGAVWGTGGMVLADPEHPEHP